MTPHGAAPRVLVMGVSGSGKSTIGAALAERYGVPLIEADDFHSAANRQKMHAGIALTDADRAPWLAAIHARLVSEPGGWILACSALREAYRGVLFSGIANVAVLWLTAPAEILAGRLQARHAHFMSPDLLTSQFDTLEPPQGAVVVDVSGSVDDSVRQAIAGLQGS
ncbi:MAG: gluconokinase [Tepidiformaceae bacterium]